MAQIVHSVDLLAGSDNALLDRVRVGFKIAVPTLAGSGAGAAVTTAVAGLDLPLAYSVVATPDQDAVAYITGKTQTGFNVVLNPRLAANTLAAGHVDILILG